MALTDTFVKQVKLVKPTGDKYTDGEGMYLLVLASGKYRRMEYRYLGKRKTMALGVYPATSLAKARLKRADVREKLANGIEPSLSKREERDAQTIAASQTFERRLEGRLVPPAPPPHTPQRHSIGPTFKKFLADFQTRKRICRPLLRRQRQGAIPGTKPSDSAGTIFSALGSITGRLTMELRA